MSYPTKIACAALAIAGCGISEPDSQPVAQALQESATTVASGSDTIEIPLGRRNVVAYLSENERALVLDPFDDRGFAALRENLPVAEDSRFNSEGIVVVHFDNRADREKVEEELKFFISTGVVRDVAYIAQDANQRGDTGTFLITNSATIYPTPGTNYDELQDAARDLDFEIYRSEQFGRVTYELRPSNPFQDPSTTMQAAKRLAELQLIDSGRTRSNLVQTAFDKKR